MRLFSSYKLRTQFTSLIVLSMVLIIFIGFFSYSSFDSLTRKGTLSYSTTLVSQIDEKISSMLKDLNTTSRKVAYSKAYRSFINSQDVMQRLDYIGYMKDILDYVITSNSNIVDIAIFDVNERFFSYYSDTQTEEIIADAFSKYYKPLNKGEQSALSDLLVSTDKKYYFAYILPITDIGEGANQIENVGASLVLCNTNGLNSMMDKLSLTPNSKFLIVDGNNRIVAGNDSALQGQTAALPEINEKNEKETSLESDYNGIRSVIQFHMISGTQWKLISIIPTGELSYNIKNIRSFMLLIGICIFIMLTITCILINKNIFDPIYRISEFMKTSGDDYKSLQNKLGSGYKNEIGDLIRYIDQSREKLKTMTATIFSTQSRLYEAELTKKQIELSALQSQINPHFLYNTLECIRSIAILHDENEVAEISSSLARIFRYAIKSSDFVHFKDELHCISNYMNIMNIRFKDKLMLILDIDQDIMEMLIPKMILQPLVENAIYHGIEPRSGLGRIVITGRISNGEIHILIEDNGIGIGEDDLLKIRTNLDSDYVTAQPSYSGREIGIVNINRRIKLEYGLDYGLEIDSSVGGGTKVKLVFPSNKGVQ